MIKIIPPTGFCYGVKNAVDKAKQASLEHKKDKVYLLRPIVHNAKTNDQLVKEARISSYDPSLPPQTYQDAYFLMPAHGYTKRDALLVHYLRATPIDCTCPFLLASKSLMKKDIKNGRHVFFIGKKDHAETLSVLDYDPNIVFISQEEARAFDFSKWKDLDNISVYPQSTFSYDEYEDFQIRFTDKFHSFKDIVFAPLCHECLQRWNKIASLNENPDSSFVVIGDETSSNAVEFFNFIKKRYPEGHVILINSVSDLENKVKGFNPRLNVYVCSATSSSQLEVDEILIALRKALRGQAMSHLHLFKKK